VARVLQGVGAAPVLSAAACGLLSAVLLVRRERRGIHPLLPHALFETCAFAAAYACALLLVYRHIRLGRPDGAA
jgi:DHA2 family methylenomycin A resistance protein-like MFS transporter